MAGSVSLAGVGVALAAGEKHTSKDFAGAKVNGGTVTHEMKDGRHVLTLSDDFKVPDTPDPHWQVVDTQGNAYLLNRLMIKGDKLNKTVTLPAYVRDVAKVQIWCAFAETNLGEAPFEPPVK
jgi:hypothetical protein